MIILILLLLLLLLIIIINNKSYLEFICSWYIYYCDFISYLLVISNFLEQEVILLLQKIIYVVLCIIHLTSGNYNSQNI